MFKKSVIIVIMALTPLGVGWAQQPLVKNAGAMEQGTPPIQIIQPVANEFHVMVGDNLFTVYRWADTVYKPVLWPINGPHGTVTRGWPLKPALGDRVDHPHHIGSWMNHGAVNKHDFWNNSTLIGAEHKGPFGRIIHQSARIDQEGDKALLKTEAVWVGAQKEEMLREKTTYSFFTLPGLPGYAFERTTELTALTDVTFTDNKEGMFAIRVSRELEQPSTKTETFSDANGVATKVPGNPDGLSKGKYLSSKDLEGDAVWGKQASWIALQSPTKAVAIFSHPSNMVGNEEPHWHARGYGLFAVNPLGAQAYDPAAKPMTLTLKKGETKRLKFLVHVLTWPSEKEKPSADFLKAHYQTTQKKYLLEK